jgi:hypothetical protein
MIMATQLDSSGCLNSIRANADAAAALPGLISIMSLALSEMA